MGMAYSMAGPAGAGMDAPHTGIMGINRQMREMGLTDTAWSVYFEVPDCDAIVALADAKGGPTVMPPITMEGVGGMALLADPFGARFSVSLWWRAPAWGAGARAGQALVMTEKRAPKGSASRAMRPTPSMVMGGMTMEPPLASARAAIASQSGTSK